MKSHASHSEIDLLNRLHRVAWGQLAALKQLPERSPEDELRLRSVMRLEQRLTDRIQAMSALEEARERSQPALHWGSGAAGALCLETSGAE